MKKFFKKLWTSFEDALFVNFDCMFCGVETLNESKVCPKCESKLKFINGEVCETCGSPVEKSEKVCYNCFDKKYYFDKHRSCIIYDRLSSAPVRKLKYYKAKHLAEPVARFMFAVHKEIIKSADFITFVPISDKRLEERGYNQTEEIAKYINEISGVPVLKILEKVKDTESQAELGFAERTKNLKGSFEILENAKQEIKGNNIVIVDDVFTTGSTSSECSRVLKKYKPKSVNVITFVKTDPNIEFEELPF